MRPVITIATICVLLTSCSEEVAVVKKAVPLFVQKSPEVTNIDFSNDLGYSKDFNVYKYRNFYNGGGVALGDVNNDGRTDIYMTANQQPNKLYINKGDWQFEDVTATAGVSGTRAWSTGTTMVDINGDGLLDIYVCNSGDVQGDNKENELFVNNGDGTYTEAAAEYGLNDKGYSTHTSFFDYDKDGDLDAYILNNSFQAIGSFNLRKSERPVRDELGGDKLMENRNGRFVDVSEQAGIYGSVIGFGLGVTVGDVNNDNWEDIFVSNDFFERDYLYINQQDGTFAEELVASMPSISGASMGADIGDIDNDGYNDIFVTEMLPSDYERLKSVTTFESWDRYQYSVTNGYHHQFTRNTLHHNNGNSTFSEVSRYAGVEASDWSWGALFFDMDLDGYKDLFIANGIYKDLTDQDYLQYIANESVLKSVIQDDGVNYKELIDIIPSNKVPNHAYRNVDGLQFDRYDASGLEDLSFSNGSAYGDLDNDGDLDLVVNNVNMPCFIYENTAADRAANAYVAIRLEGAKPNTMAVGAKVIVTAGDMTQTVENQPARGFQSSMDSKLIVGVGTATSVDVKVIWPDGKTTVKKGLAVNSSYTLNQSEGVATAQPATTDEQLLTLATGYINYVQKENTYVDFNRERLLYHMMSTRGPCASVGDMNGDGKQDLVLPGAKGSPTSIQMATDGGYVAQPSTAALDKLTEAEHVECELFDADGDGDLDVYVASGGVELTKFSPLLYDKLLINDGSGQLTASTQNLPSTEARISSSVVCHADIDGDGDMDLFVGERSKIGSYGAPCSGYLLVNDGKGKFTDKTVELAPALVNIGMITDAVFVDLDGQGRAELVVVGEFMPVTIFHESGGTYTKVSRLEKTTAWWQSLQTEDIDGDGDQDLIVGNHGTNSRFRADSEHPIKLYYGDYDANGTAEGIMTSTRADGRDSPYALRHSLQAQLPMLKKRYPDYKSYKSAAIDDIFTVEELAGVEVLEATEMRSMVFVNEGNLKFTARPLPSSVQVSPMYAIAATDVDSDGDMDLLMGGNLYKVQPEVGRYDASYGHVLINDGKGNFVDKATEVGFSVQGEIRDIEVIDGVIYVFRNDDAALTFTYK